MIGVSARSLCGVSTSQNVDRTYRRRCTACEGVQRHIRVHTKTCLQSWPREEFQPGLATFQVPVPRLTSLTHSKAGLAYIVSDAASNKQMGNNNPVLQMGPHRMCYA